MFILHFSSLMGPTLYSFINKTVGFVHFQAQPGSSRINGLPETALSDRGPQFTAEFMCELNNILGIQTKLSTAYHPQTDGQTKRLNQDVEQYLRLFVSQRQNGWPEWIACAEFVYNNKVHSATKISPFYANYG